MRTRQLLVPWGERQAFLRDEEKARSFAEARGRPNQALSGAICAAMVATGYNDAWAEDDGAIEMEAAELREVARLAGLPQNLEDLHEAAYVDRHGGMHLPAEVAEKLAHAYAAAEPEAVLMYIEDEENELKAKGYKSGERFYHDYLREKTLASRSPATGLGTKPRSHSYAERSIACAISWRRLLMSLRRADRIERAGG